jgi:hypothetical protein
MNEDNEPLHLADLADGVLTGAEWDAWLVAHPEQRDELLAARRAHLLLAQLRDMPVALPADFEERLLDRLRHDATILDLLDHWLAGWGRALLELLELLLSGRQTPSEAPPH